MTQADQARAFQADIAKLLARYRREFDLTGATAIGVLEIVKLDLWHEMVEEQAEDDGEEWKGVSA